MNPNQIKNEIQNLKERIHELEEYLISDCCKQCVGIIKTVEKYQEQIELLKNKTKE
jgi:hypothetical protein